MALQTRQINSADVTPINRPFSYPGTGANFARAVSSMRLDEDILFGSGVSPGATQSSIKNANELTSKFRPLEGEFAANGSHLGGAGPTTINSEPQNYRDTFINSPNIVFDADCLRIQSVLEAGTYNLIVRGALLSTSAGGLNVNLPGATVTTAIADIGLTTSDLANLEVGTVANRANNGYMVVSAKDAGAGTITFEEATSGPTTAYKANWALNFWKIAFCRIDPTKTVATGDVTIPLAKALPSWVVPGMIVRGVRRTSGAVQGQDPRSGRDMRVGTIASDRLSFTIPGGFNQGSNFTLEGTNFAGVMILPGLSSSQIWSRKNYGSQLSDILADGVTSRKRVAQAIQVEMTQPAMTWGAPVGTFNKAALDTYQATYPTAAFGYFPAIWLYGWRPGPNGDGQSTTASVPWNEIDIYECFGRPGQGGRAWTGNLHFMPYTRKGNVDSISGTPNRHRALKATWETTTADVKMLTPDRAVLTFDNPLTDGVKHTYGVLWTDSKVIHYVDGVVVCESDWSVEHDFPHQLGINLAMGMMTFSQAANFILPMSDAMAVQNIKIHRIQSWSY